jgi:hypothetical protein
MATINQCYNLLIYRCNKAGYLTGISPDDFNLLWPQAELRFFNSKYKEYGLTKKINDTLSKVKSAPIAITVDNAGKYTFPTDLLHESSITHTYQGTQREVVEFEDDRLANKLSSDYDAPNEEFPIYVRYNTYFQFYPITLATAILTYLKQPVSSFWAYTLIGVATTNTLVGGSGYTTGIYTNVPFVGGTGTGAKGSISVVGGVVTNVAIDVPGSNYTVGDTLTVTTANLGGTGSGFTVKVATTTANRPVYDPVNSVQPVWSSDDVDAICYLIMQDFGIFSRDQEAENFAQVQFKTQS